MSKVCIDDKAALAREIYFACQELPTDKVDPTLPECEIIAEKILAKVSGHPVGLTIDEIAIIISEWMAIDEGDRGIQNAAKRIHELSQPTKRESVDEILWKKLEVAKDALDRLSRIGNEPYLGNSTGNQIAQKALNTIYDNQLWEPKRNQSGGDK